LGPSTANSSLYFSSWTQQQQILTIIFSVGPVNSQFLPVFFQLDSATANFDHYFFSWGRQLLIPACIFPVGVVNSYFSPLFFQLNPNDRVDGQF